jgi:hypothetical protein
MADGRMIVQLYCMTTGEVISSVTALSGSPVSLTGAIDLPVGDHQICIRMYPEEAEAYGDWSGASLQIILGQTVDERGCIPGGTCG